MARSKKITWTTLAEIMIDFREEHMPDLRRVILDSDQANINEVLAKKILYENIDFYGEKEIEEVLFLARKYTTPEMYIGFTYTENQDSYGNIHNQGWKEIFRFHLMHYIAATYEKYDLETVQMHAEEIDSGIHGEEDSVMYLTLIKKYNKNLPDDLKLWLELFL